MSMNGECGKCDFYREDRCIRAEKVFSTLTDPVCLAKIQVLLLRDICLMLNEYFYEDEENN